MRKRGDIVLPEFLRIFLAILVIVILVFLAYQLYSILMKKTVLEQARATLSAIIGKINDLEENGKEGDVVDYIVTAPVNWYLVSYNKEIIEKNEELGMPRTCYLKDCLCICPAVNKIRYVDVDGKKIYFAPGFSRFDDIKKFMEQAFYKGNKQICEEKGICINIENVKIERIQKYLANIDPVAPGVIEREANVNWIALPNFPKNVILTKKSDKIFIDEKL